jgi:hypothetical protein
MWTCGRTARAGCLASVTTAESGGALESQAAGTVKRGRGRPVGSLGAKKRNHFEQGRELPAPLESAPSPESAPAPNLLDGVRNLFQVPNPSTVAANSISSHGSGASLAEGAVSPENLRLLASVPESIGGTVQDEAGAAAAPGAEADPIASLMAQVVFEPQDVQDVLTEFFDWLALRAKSDHWQLSERQGRMLARPLATVLDSLWARLQVLLPDVLGRWCESTPGAMALLMAAGLVIGPKVAKQAAMVRARKKTVPMVKETKPDPVRAPAPAAPLPAGPVGGGIVYESAA